LRAHDTRAPPDLAQDALERLKKGSRVYWRGDADDSGRITEISWDAVTIAWDTGQVATVHHGDMREIQRMPTKRTAV
jgi:preprotein translocase subunit YajC